MESLKLQKLCGYIIYIKSVVATIFATILFLSGIHYCTTLNTIKENPETLDDLVTNTTSNCTNLISLIAGFSYIIIAIVIVVLFLLYLFHGRKMIYSKIYQKKLSVVSLVVESICCCAFSEYFVSSIFMGFSWELIYIFIILPILIAQTLFTIYLLAKSLETYNKEVNA